MSMNDMLADMLKKAIPPEVMELLSKEQIEAMGEKINAFVLDIRENFGTVIANQMVIIQRQADDHTAIMNELGALREEILDGRGNSRSACRSGGSGGGKSDGASNE